MGKVFADISMSLDGFIAGPNDEIDPLHDWGYGLKSFHERHGREGGEASRDSEILAEAFDTLGAAIMGRRMYDLAGGWGDTPPFGTPVFVLTHERRDGVSKGKTTFSFVDDTAAGVLRRAQAAAGEMDVAVSGGANVIQQFLAAGLLDEIQIHLVPVLLGSGIRLFDGIGPDQIGLETMRVIESPAPVTHLKFRVAR